MKQVFRITKMRIYSLIILTLLVFSGCIERPNFPDVPSIEFSNIYFVDAATDSLVVSLAFEDGDGDLGLATNQTSYPFHQINIYSRVTGQELNEKAFVNNTSINLSEAIRFADRRTGAIDSLPPFQASACDNWIFEQNLQDTLYFQFNPYQYNIVVDFLTRDPQGSFELFDFGCGVNYNGRFPVLIDEDRDKSVEGNLTYKIQGAVLGDILDRKIIKLRIYIYDRALNRSNIIETPEFILNEIAI